jgi:hypothetical protein
MHHEPGKQLIERARFQAELDRLIGQYSAQQVFLKVAREGSDTSNTQLLPGGLALAFHRGHELGTHRENSLSMAQHHLTGFGDDQTPAFPGKKRQTKLTFQLLDLR